MREKSPAYLTDWNSSKDLDLLCQIQMSSQFNKACGGRTWSRILLSSPPSFRILLKTCYVFQGLSWTINHKFGSFLIKPKKFTVQESLWKTYPQSRYHLLHHSPHARREEFRYDLILDLEYNSCKDLSCLPWTSSILVKICHVFHRLSWTMIIPKKFTVQESMWKT